MRITSQLLLTFLLNACWQIALIAALAALGSRILRKSVARYHHWIWVSALCLSLLVPATVTLRVAYDTLVPIDFTEIRSARGSVTQLAREIAPDAPIPTFAARESTLQLNQALGMALLALYCAILLYRIFKLVRAWQTTRTIKRLALPIEPDDKVQEVIGTCERQLGTRSQSVKVFRSLTLPVPVTIGFRHPLIILPDALLHEGNVELLTSAIGHELIHVARRDYVLNLIYELIFLPISFHPAAVLIRRRIKETRELCCDELVAERILNAEVYARSLVQLAGSAPPLRRLSVTTTVGIADADILEARIMSLLKKPELNTPTKKLLLVAVSLLLVVPCVAAAGFAKRFDVETNAQEPAAQDRELREKAEKEKVETKRREPFSAEMKERMERDPAFREEIERKERVEAEMREVRQAALVRLAKINMDQAIQIATSQQAGKVLFCSLDANHWEAPGKLASDGLVFYRVIIANEGDAGSTLMLVNAIDGTIIKTEKELPRKRQP
jgi:beta-lactamase regulating signal transducer with metallopeptidase domain